MVSTPKKKHQNKRQLNQLNETLNHSIIGNKVNASAIGNETMKPQASGLSKNFGGSSVGKTVQVKIKSLKRRSTTKSEKRLIILLSVMTVENRVHATILTAVCNVVIPRVEMAVGSITELSGRRPSSVAQNRDQGDFSGNTENTPLMSGSSQTDLNIDENRNDQTCNVENFEDGEFLALRPQYDRDVHAHHIEFCFSHSPEVFFQRSTQIDNSTEKKFAFDKI